MRASLDTVTARLAAAGCVAAPQEAAELVVAAPDAPTLDEWIARREHGEPLAWITGRVTFGGVRLHAAAGVYVPRPHSELLAARACACLPAGGRALDLCTGTGAIASVLAAHDPSAVVVGCDRDPSAAACARANGVPSLVSDVADAVGGDRTWDVVTAVAPYVPTGALHLLPSDVLAHEPRAALDGGADGLELVRRIVVDATRLLRSGGHLLLEIGGDQPEDLAPFLVAHGFTDLSVRRDDDGDARGIECRFGG